MTEENNRRKLLLGICVMDKKARAKPMTRLLEIIHSYAEFEIVHFGNECILQQPIEQWPIVDVLIAFYSDGFPLAKVSIRILIYSL
jgi:inositol hexakisphosphate/diphosphoinositol-pentakisphosphate kinase